jgi:tetratricopeptide (TPR) repeat protein
VLEAASVLGNDFTVGSVAIGLGGHPLAVEERCDALAREGQFLSAAGLSALPDGTQVARYRFTHNLYPHLIAERVHAGWRLRLHQRVGEWLERAYGAQATGIAGALAWHFEEAGDYPRAISYLVLAAQNAAGRFAYADAIRVLEQARSLTHHLAGDARSQLEVELLQRMGDAHFGRGAMIQCAEAYEAAATRAADVCLTSAQVDALISLVRPFCFIDPGRGMAAIEQAVHLSANLDDPLRHARTDLLAAYVRLTFDTWRMKDWEIAAAASETIYRLSEVGPPAFDRVIYAHLQLLRGDYTGALKNLGADTPNENEPSGVVHFLALSARTLALLLSGRLGELVRLLRSGRESAEENNNEPWFFVFREAWLHTAVLDFTGARQLCERMAAQSASRYWHGQSKALGGVASGYAALKQGKYKDASRSFRRVIDSKESPKFFLHWYWRMHAELGLSNVWLASGDLGKARGAADGFLRCALSTAEPNLQALAWDLDARVAMAENDWRAADQKIERGLAILVEFEIPVTAWRLHATRSDLWRQAKNEIAEEAHRERAGAIILDLANSFASDDPLRDAFLAATPVRRILHARSQKKHARQRRVQEAR